MEFADKDTYLSNVAKHAGDSLRYNRNAKAYEKFLGMEAGRKEAEKSFPNNLGGYPGKRPERPAVAPLTPAQRFHNLVAYYVSKRRAYREQKPGKPKNLPFMFEGRAIGAATKSEARAIIKKRDGISSTAGRKVFAFSRSGAA